MNPDIDLSNVKKEDKETTEKEDIISKKTKQVFDLSKKEQVKIIEGLDLNPKKYPKEQDRVDVIMEYYNKDSEKMDSTLNAVENYVPTADEERILELESLSKKEQINLLLEHGLAMFEINALKYEKDRVNRIFKIESRKKKKSK